MGDAEVVVELSHDEVKLLALEITLLAAGLISMVALRSHSKQRVELTPGSRDVRATLRVLQADYVQVGLSQNQMEYLQMVLLRAYRDEMAEVNHVHLEGECAGREMAFTVLFETFRPPLSPAEAEKLMGDS
jgi:hypothetical protein